MTDLILLCCIFGFAGFVQGASGFGFGLTALGLLAAVGDLREAAILTALGSLALSIAIFLRLRSHFAWDRVRPLFLVSLLTIPVGVLVLKGSPGTGLQLGLGVLLVFTAVYNLVPRLAAQPWHAFWTGVPCGVLSGILAGAFGTGGPPAVAYVATQGFSRQRYVATLQLLFAMGGVVRVSSLVATGLLTPALAGVSALGAFFAVIGARLGVRVLTRLSDKAFRSLVAVLLLLLGARYLVQAVG